MKYILLIAIVYLVYRFYVRASPEIKSGPDDGTTYIDYEEIEDDEE